MRAYAVSLWYFISVLVVVLGVFSMEKQESLDFVLSFVKFASFNMRFAVFIVSVHFLFLNVVSLISLHTMQSPGTCLSIFCFSYFQFISYHRCLNFFYRQRATRFK